MGSIGTAVGTKLRVFQMKVVLLVIARNHRSLPGHQNARTVLSRVVQALERLASPAALVDIPADQAPTRVASLAALDTAAGQALARAASQEDITTKKAIPVTAHQALGCMHDGLLRWCMVGSRPCSGDQELYSFHSRHASYSRRKHGDGNPFRCRIVSADFSWFATDLYNGNDEQDSCTMHCGAQFDMVAPTERVDRSMESRPPVPLEGEIETANQQGDMSRTV